MVVLGNVAEGVRVWRQFHGSTLVISSGSYTSVMKEHARAMGVPDEAMIVESEGRDTQEQAVKLKAILRGERFILSTWALHMPRTLLTFKSQGLESCPCSHGFPLACQTLCMVVLAERFWDDAHQTRPS